MVQGLSPTFSVGSGDIVTIKGKKYHLTDPGHRAGFWKTKEGKEIDVADASQTDELDHVFNPAGDEVYDRESNKKIVGAINAENRLLAGQTPKAKKKDKKPS